MTDENQNHDGQASERDVLGRQLVAALAKYADVEPRAGLEQRVLASLRAERERIPDRSSWRWSVVPALMLAAMVIVVALALRTSTQRAPAVGDHPSTATPGVEQPGPTVASNGGGKADNPPAPRPTIGPVMRRPHPVAVAESHPILDQFPSPHPLSEQEKLLASYVEAYPRYAVLLARARTEALQRDQFEEMQVSASADGAPDSEDRNKNTAER